MQSYCGGWETRSYVLVYIIRVDVRHASGEMVVAFGQRDSWELKDVSDESESNTLAS